MVCIFVFFRKKVRNIWWYEKKVVPLHAFSCKKHTIQSIINPSMQLVQL